MDCIPTSLICKRWSKDIKNDFIATTQQDELDTDIMMVTHFGCLSAACNKLCHVASKNIEYFNEVRDEILKLTNKLEKEGDKRSTRNSSAKDVGDPTVVKTKGTPVKKKYGRKRRCCSNCNRTGHIIRLCPRLLNKDEPSIQNDELSTSESLGISREVDSVSCFNYVRFYL